jgi:hypothetical protein
MRTLLPWFSDDGIVMGWDSTYDFDATCISSIDSDSESEEDKEDSNNDDHEEYPPPLIMTSEVA